MARALVALGSNLGDRGATIRGALADLGRVPGTRLVAASPLHETPPEAPGDGGPFLNAAALVETRLDPAALLAALHRLEARHGRRRRRAGRGPRTLDLDLVLMDGVRSGDPRARVPHPRFRGRAFVLDPAAQVAPGMRDPETGQTVAGLRARLPRAGERPWSG